MTRDPSGLIANSALRSGVEALDLCNEGVESDHFEVVPELMPVRVDSAARAHVDDEHRVVLERSPIDQQPGQLWGVVVPRRP